jgi:hypothetical protein
VENEGDCVLETPAYLSSTKLLYHPGMDEKLRLPSVLHQSEESSLAVARR